MTLKKTLRCVGLAIPVAAVLGAISAAEAADVRYGLWAKKGEAQHLGALKFKEVLEADSNGDFKVTIYPGNQLGTPREMHTQLALNTTQIMASGDPGIKEIEYLALPYLMKGINNYAAVINSPIGEEWNKKLVKTRKMLLLGFLPRSPRQISSNKVIKKMSDLNGLKLRSPQRDYYVESLSAFGAKPTPMAFKEVYTALQTGVVDGQENPIETIYA
ncbi:MAG: TRAP transporter substrate-binding protein, partial [Alphaproteobacteria bacterium]|nr:TRAP transporter substrate-binding protein [Alphaproteobacteria bacterium]